MEESGRDPLPEFVKAELEGFAGRGDFARGFVAFGMHLHAATTADGRDRQHAAVAAATTVAAAGGGSLNSISAARQTAAVAECPLSPGLPPPNQSS